MTSFLTQTNSLGVITGLPDVESSSTDQSSAASPTNPFSSIPAADASVITPSQSESYTPEALLPPFSGSVGNVPLADTTSDTSSSTLPLFTGSGADAISTSPGSSPTTDSATSDNSGLSTGAKAGIGVGVGIAALLCVGVFLFLRNTRRSQKSHLSWFGQRTNPEKEVDSDNRGGNNATKYQDWTNWPPGRAQLSADQAPVSPVTGDEHLSLSKPELDGQEQKAELDGHRAYELSATVNDFREEPAISSDPPPVPWSSKPRQPG